MMGTILLYLTAGLTALVALAAWRRRRVPGARALVTLMLAVTIWLLAAAQELAAADLATKMA